jgi:hypothetical protein
MAARPKYTLALRTLIKMLMSFENMIRYLIREDVFGDGNDMHIALQASRKRPCLICL